MIKNAMLAVVAAGSLAVMADEASAATFQGTFDVNFNSSDPGLVVQVVPDSGYFGPFNLDVGESKKFHIFNIWTNETAINRDDKKEKPISVAFDFSSPLTSGTLSGSTVGKVDWCIWKACAIQYGKLDWDDPLHLTFGPGGTGELSVSLSDAIFNKGLFGTKPGEHWGAKVYATVTYKVEPIPLPAAGWMLLAGVGGLAAMKRRRKAA